MERDTMVISVVLVGLVDKSPNVLLASVRLQRKTRQ